MPYREVSGTVYKRGYGKGREVRRDRKDSKKYNSYKLLSDVVECDPPNVTIHNTRRKEERAHILLSQEQDSALVLARTQLTFAIVKRGYCRDLEVILYHLTSFSGGRGRGSFQVL